MKIDWSGDLEFEATTEGGFSVKIDGKDERSPCPTQLMLSALGACSASDVVSILKSEGYALQSLENNVTYTLTDSKPRLFDTANLHFVAKCHGLGESELLAAAEEAVAQHCHVCLMLRPAIEISCSAEVIWNPPVSA